MDERVTVGPGGATSRETLSQADIDKKTADATAEAQRATAEATRRAAVNAAMPGPTIRQKLKDGTALTAGELQIVVRWLALREALEILD